MPNRGTFTSVDFSTPEGKLIAQYGGKAKYLAAKKARDDAKKKYTAANKPYEESNKNLLALLNTPLYGLYAKLNDAKQANNQTLVSSINAQISQTRDKIAENNRAIYRNDVAIKAAQDKFLKKKVTDESPNGTNGDILNPGKTSVGTYYYNAPLVESNNFLNKGDLPKMISAGGYPTGDAYTFWSNSDNFTSYGSYLGQTISGGKGTIQMDRIVNDAKTKAEAQKQATANKVKFDGRMFGFKFQYNPTTVNMNWSGFAGANPVYEMLNKDPSIPIASSLFASTISFDIILNRIQDIALLNADGSYKHGKEIYGKGISVDPNDLKDIANKGTMYDIEYLLKTLHGWSGYGTYTSVLNGKTNDPGWLPVRPVELHLGNKLRYRVRVSNLEIVHKIFSDRMIPLLSVVSVTCMRYWDNIGIGGN